MADWNNPVIGTAYADVLSILKDRDTDLAKMFDGVSPSNLPTGAVRWNSSSGRFEKWNGTAWGELVAKYLINVDKLDGYLAGNASGQIPVSNGVLCNNLNAQKLNGLERSGFLEKTGGVLTGTIQSKKGPGSHIIIQKADGTAVAAISHTETGSDRFYIVPYIGGSPEWSKEFSFNPATGRWEFDTVPYVGSDMIYHAGNHTKALHDALGIDADTAGSLTMQGEASAENASLVTVLSSSTTIVTLNLGDVTAGDRIHVEGFAGFQKGGTAGRSYLYISKSSGTATVKGYHDEDFLTGPTLYHPASALYFPTASGVLKVTVSGTLVLKLVGVSDGSDSTVIAGNGDIYAFFLKKQ